MTAKNLQAKRQRDTDWAPFPHEIGESFTLGEYVSEREPSLCFDERSYGWTNWSATLDSTLRMNSANLVLSSMTHVSIQGICLPQFWDWYA